MEIEDIKVDGGRYGSVLFACFARSFTFIFHLLYSKHVQALCALYQICLSVVRHGLSSLMHTARVSYLLILSADAAAAARMHPAS